MAAHAFPEWRHLAEAARDEEDPQRLMRLIEELNRVLAKRAEDLNPQLSKAEN